MTRLESIRTSTTGSYLGLYVTSCISTAMFGIAMGWHFLTESLFFDLIQSQYQLMLYVLITWTCFGWLMCLIAGIGFDILPLIHGSSPFHEDALRQFILMNFAGQTILFISTFMNTAEQIQEFATIGISFLCIAVILLGRPGRRLYRDSKMETDGDEVGTVSLVPGLAFPFLGGLILVCWMWRGTPGMLELGRSVMIMLYVLFTLIMIISHFNRRLNWHILAPEKISLRIRGFFFLCLLHILFAFLSGREATESDTLINQMNNYTLGMVLFYAFIMSNPLSIMKKAWTGERMAHNTLILAALCMLPFSAFHAFNSASYLDRPGSPGYATFISTSALLAIWGYSQYLHLDHLHINIHKRKSNIPFMACFLIGFTAIQVLFIKNWFELGSTDLEQKIWIISLATGSVLMVFNLLRQTMLSFETWHRVPMFYGRYIQNSTDD